MTDVSALHRLSKYSGLNLNQDKATKPQTVQIVRQGEATPYWFKFNPLYKKMICCPSTSQMEYICNFIFYMIILFYTF